MRRFGDYELLEEIARGGMGVVFKARQANLNRIVAVKMILAGQLASPAEVQRFHAEAEAAARLQHPNIVAIHEIGQHDGQHYFSMDFVEGQNLGELVRNRPLPSKQAAKYLKAIAQAINFAHEHGILHRDLKPSNILIDQSDQPRVTDFGLARQMKGDSDLTLSGQVLGSPNFMPPEQAAGKRSQVGPHSDVYSLGAILYYLLTARAPFVAETMTETLQQVVNEQPPAPRLLNPGISRDLETICLKSLEKEPGKRYATAQELADELGRFLADEPIRARPVGPAGKTWRWCRRKPALASALLVVLVLLLVLGIGSPIAIFRINRERQRTEHEAFVSRENLYAADVSLAQQAWDGGNLGRARSLLEAHWPLLGQIDLRGFEWRYFWKLCQGDQLHTFVGHSNVVTCVAFSPDGKTLASGSRDGTVKLWDVVSKTLIATLPAHSNGVVSVAFSPSGEILGVGTETDGVKLWNLGTRKVTATLEGVSARIAFSPVGTLLAIGSGGDIYGNSGGVVTLWDYGTGQRVLSLPESGGRATFCPDGKTLATANWNGAIKLWDVSTGMLIRTLEGAGEVLSIMFSSNGRTLASGNWKGQVQFWDVATGNRLGDIQAHVAMATAIAFLPAGDTLVTAGGDHAVRLWNVADRKELATLRGHGNEVWAMSLSPHDKLLVTGSKDETVMLWRAEPKKEEAVLLEVVSPRAVTPGGDILAMTVSGPVFSPDSKMLAIGSDKDEVRIWDVLSRQTTAAFKGERVPLAFSPDSKSLMTTDLTNSIKTWEVASGSNLLTVALTQKAFPIPIFWVVISPGRTVLAAGDAAGRAALWDTRTGQIVAALPGHRQTVRGRAFTPDGQVLVTASDVVKLWNVTTQKELMPLVGHRNHILGAAFSPDGKTLATASIDDTVKLWERLTGKALATLTGHTQGAYAVAFSPDGRTLAASSGNGDVKLWNLATLREVAYLRHAKTVTFVVFSPDGQTLATVDEDQMLHLWSAPFQGASHLPRSGDGPSQ